MADEGKRPGRHQSPFGWVGRRVKAPPPEGDTRPEHQNDRQELKREQR